jgi:hypothetical protein
LRAASERTVISTSHGFEGCWPEHVLALRQPPAEAVAEARQQLAVYREVCRPLHEDDLAVELTKLREVTKASREAGHDWSIGLDVMLDELSTYPADLVLWAIRFWRRNEKWWPTPSELHGLIERRNCGRKAIMDGLRRLIEFGEAAVQEPAP